MRHPWLNRIALSLFGGLPLVFCGASAHAQQKPFQIEAELTEMVRYAAPAMVTIISQVPFEPTGESSFFSFFTSKSAGTENTEKQYTLVGSGLYADENGYVITRSTLLEKATAVYVKLWNGEQMLADLVGLDKETGVGVLKIDSARLYTLPYVNRFALVPGTYVVVIGNSLGESPALSVGTITEVDRAGYTHIIANIDPGSIGAPVLDAEGRVLGIVSAAMAYKDQTGRMRSSSSVLVLPIDTAFRAARRLLESYVERHGWIGITVHRGPYRPETPQIKEVKDGSPAAEAGLLPGDVILKCNGVAFEDYYSLRAIVKQARPGERLVFDLLRGQKSEQVTVRVGRWDIAGVFETPPFDEPVDFTLKPGYEWSDKSRTLLEQRLRKMEAEIKNLRRQLLFKKR